VVEKTEWIERIESEYDKIYVSYSGGKDSLASLLFTMDNFKNIPYEILWVDVNYDFPELFPYIIYTGAVTGVKINILEIPTSLEKLAPALGGLSHKSRWCGPDGKFLTIRNFFTNEVSKGNYISFEGTRWAESRARASRPIYSPPEESFVGNATFRPVIDFGDREVCNYSLQHGFSLNTTYRFFERTGCYICPEANLQDFGILRALYPNLWKKFMLFLGQCSRNVNWKKKYAKGDFERYFKININKDNFEPPYTAGYVLKDKIDRVVGFDVDTIRDNPNYTFRDALEQTKAKFKYKIIKPPEPEEHTNLIRYGKRKP
jgi:phosphoadenosine phosphosulfate reductase